MKNSLSFYSVFKKCAVLSVLFVLIVTSNAMAQNALLARANRQQMEQPVTTDETLTPPAGIDPALWGHLVNDTYYAKDTYKILKVGDTIKLAKLPYGVKAYDNIRHKGLLRTGNGQWLEENRYRNQSFKIESIKVAGGLFHDGMRIAYAYFKTPDDTFEIAIEDALYSGEIKIVK